MPDGDKYISVKCPSLSTEAANIANAGALLHKRSITSWDYKTTISAKGNLSSAFNNAETLLSSVKQAMADKSAILTSYGNEIKMIDEEAEKAAEG